MANIFDNSPDLIDLEEGDLSDVDRATASSGQTVEASSSQAHEGTYSAHTETLINYTGEYAFISKDFSMPGNNTAYFRFFVYFAATGSNSYARGLNIIRLCYNGDSFGSPSTAVKLSINLRSSDRRLGYSLMYGDGYEEWVTGYESC